MSSSFQIIKQFIFTRDIDNFNVFSNQNTLIDIKKCHNIAFYVLHCVEMVKTLV